MDIRAQMRIVAHLLDFEDIYKQYNHLPIPIFQGNIKHLVLLSREEVLTKLISSTNKDAFRQLLEIYMDKSLRQSGGDLSTAKEEIPKLFDVEKVSIHSELDEISSGTALGSLLSRGSSSSLDHNEIWEKYKAKNSVHGSYLKNISGQNLRLNIQRLLYQSGLEELRKFITKTTEGPSSLTSENSDTSRGEVEFEGFYDRKDLKRILRISDSTIQNYEKAGKLKPVAMSQRKKLYLKTDIENIKDTLRRDKYKRSSKY